MVSGGPALPFSYHGVRLYAPSEFMARLPRRRRTRLRSVVTSDAPYVTWRVVFLDALVAAGLTPQECGDFSRAIAAGIVHVRPADAASWVCQILMDPAAAASGSPAISESPERFRRRIEAARMEEAERVMTLLDRFLNGERNAASDADYRPRTPDQDEWLGDALFLAQLEERGLADPPGALERLVGRDARDALMGTVAEGARRAHYGLLFQRIAGHARAVPLARVLLATLLWLNTHGDRRHLVVRALTGLAFLELIEPDHVAALQDPELQRMLAKWHGPPPGALWRLEQAVEQPGVAADLSALATEVLCRSIPRDIAAFLIRYKKVAAVAASTGDQGPAATVVTPSPRAGGEPSVPPTAAEASLGTGAEDPPREDEWRTARERLLMYDGPLLRHIFVLWPSTLRDGMAPPRHCADVPLPPSYEVYLQPEFVAVDETGADPVPHLVPGSHVLLDSAFVTTDGTGRVGRHVLLSPALRGSSAQRERATVDRTVGWLTWAGRLLARMQRRGPIANGDALIHWLLALQGPPESKHLPPLRRFTWGKYLGDGARPTDEGPPSDATKQPIATVVEDVVQTSILAIDSVLAELAGASRVAPPSKEAEPDVTAAPPTAATPALPTREEWLAWHLYDVQHVGDQTRVGEMVGQETKGPALAQHRVSRMVKRVRDFLKGGGQAPKWLAPTPTLTPGALRVVDPSKLEQGSPKTAERPREEPPDPVEG